MKQVAHLIVASLMVAIATAMLEEGPRSLPFLIGYLLGIVVPVVVYSGVLTLLAAGVYRVYAGKNMPNIYGAMWGIWVLVAAINFYGNYQTSAEKARLAEALQVADPQVEWGQETSQPQQHGEDEPARYSGVLALQARYARATRQLDAELAGKVATVQVPPLFEPAFLEDRSRFPVAAEQLKAYGQLFREHKGQRANMLSQLKTDIEQLELPPNEKLQAIHEFNNTYAIDGTLSRQYFDIVIEVSRQGIAYLDFMNQARYEASNGRVVFESETEAGKHQAFLQTFKQLSQRELATQRELADSRNKRMAKMRELSR